MSDKSLLNYPPGAPGIDIFTGCDVDQERISRDTIYVFGMQGRAIDKSESGGERVNAATRTSNDDVFFSFLIIAHGGWNVITHKAQTFVSIENSTARHFGGRSRRLQVLSEKKLGILIQFFTLFLLFFTKNQI